MTTKSINLSIVELMFDNGKSDIIIMTKKQLAGLKKSEIRKTILSKRLLATVEIVVKHKNKPL